MIVKMTKCDNPGCRMVGSPENEKPYRPPYGWLFLKGAFMGCGPNVSVEVCSLDCLEAAVNEVVVQDQIANGQR